MIRLDGPAATTAIANVEQQIRDGEMEMLIGVIDPTPEEEAVIERDFTALERGVAELGSRAFWAMAQENGRW
jgi:hypothetical protein